MLNWVQLPGFRLGGLLDGVQGGAPGRQAGLRVEEGEIGQPILEINRERPQRGAHFGKHKERPDRGVQGGLLGR